MIYQLKPIFIEKIWGGNYYSTLFQLPQKKIGEVVLFSTHHDYDIHILGLHHEKQLKDVDITLDKNLRTLFPITIKLIDAKDDLSIQVHPDNTYARMHHQTLGKEEYWMILDAKKEATILIGHTITSKERLKECIKQGKFHQEMHHHKINAYDTFYIPANTVHAIQKNTRLLEIAQASILNFRVDDYKRLDENGQYRALHIKEALEVIDITNQNIVRSFPTHLFMHQLINVDGKIEMNLQKEIYIFIVLKGTCTIHHDHYEEGHTFITYQEKTLFIKGFCQLIMIESAL